MSFNSSTLTSSAISRIRLTIGDISEEWAILEDSVYEYLLLKNGSDEHATAIEALENIIDFYSLNPTNEAFGDVSGSNFSIRTMEKRLDALKARATADSSGVSRIPIMLKTDRKNWDDFGKVFGG